MRRSIVAGWVLGTSVWMVSVSGVAAPTPAGGATAPLEFSPGVVNARPCFPGAYYRKAVSSIGEWRGVTGVVVLPKFVPDPSRRDPKTNKVLDNPSIYMGGSAAGQEIDAGLSYEVVKEPDGLVSKERKAFRPFWRNAGWASGPADPKFYYYAGDTLRMTVETTSPGTLGLEIAVIARGEEGRRELAPYAKEGVANDFLSTLTVSFEAKNFGPGRKQEFKRVNAIDQVGREGKGVAETATRVEGAEWLEVWLLRTAEKLPFTEKRFDDMRCPSVDNVVVSPGGKAGFGGEKITILGNKAARPQ